VLLPVVFLTLLAAVDGPAVAGGGATTAKSKPTTVTFSPTELAATRLTTTHTIERVPLGQAGASLENDAFRGRLTLSLPKADAKRVAQALASRSGGICPRAMADGKSVTLVCRTRRLEAAIVTEKGVPYLELEVLRGLPWRTGSDGPPDVPFDTWHAGFHQKCPGHAPVVKGECLLGKGDFLHAAAQFRAGLETMHRAFAALRLGDISLRIGDAATAVGWYRRAGSLGPWGRLAQARLCELDGECLEDLESFRTTFDASGLSEELRAEMVRRTARARVFLGEPITAARVITSHIREYGAGVLCRDKGELFCRRILLLALRRFSGLEAPLPGEVDAFAADRRAGGDKKPVAAAPEGAPPTSAPAEVAKPETEALTPLEDLDGPDAESTSLETDAGRERAVEVFEAYLSLPDWDRGPLAVELSEAGGALAVRMGAPDFGGHILAAAVADLEARGDAKALPEHLLVTAETYLAARDFVRAELIAEFAQTRLPKGTFASPRWKRVMAALAAEVNEPVERPLTPEDAERIDRELAASEEALRKAVEAHRLAAALVDADIKAKKLPAAAAKAPAAVPAAGLVSKADAPKSDVAPGPEPKGGARP